MSERKTIYLCLAHMSEEGYEKKFVQEAFETNWVVPLGPNVNAFEESLHRFVTGDSESAVYSDSRWPEANVKSWHLKDNLRNKEVVALNSGTSAVHLALLACGIGAGDEVIVQSFTFCASSHPIAYCGAMPVFVDSEPESWNMDPELLEIAIKDRIKKTGRKPKAIVPVALYGMPYDIERIMDIADRYEIPVIEDAAEGMGSRWKGQVLGTFGDYGILSFNGNKMITTSGGGALIVKDKACKDHIMWMATQARDAYPYYQHSAIGYNYRLSNVSAGIGRGQMRVLDSHLAHHRHVQQLYEELLKDVKGISVHRAPDERYDSNYWLCTITLDPELQIKGQENAYKEVVKTAVGGAAGVIHQVESPVTDCQPNENVEALRVYMLAKKIEARPVWKPMHKQPCYCKVAGQSAEVRVQSLENGVICQTSETSVAYVNGVSERIFKVGMCLPAGPYVSDDDVRYIVDCIKEAII